MFHTVAQSCLKAKIIKGKLETFELSIFSSVVLVAVRRTETFNEWYGNQLGWNRFSRQHGMI